MKIIVLAGGLSTERDVSLSSSAGICKTLVEKGHEAYLLEVFLGLENPPANRRTSFLCPDTGWKSRRESVPQSRTLKQLRLPAQTNQAAS